MVTRTNLNSKKVVKKVFANTHTHTSLNIHRLCVWWIHTFWYIKIPDLTANYGIVLDFVVSSPNIHRFRVFINIYRFNSFIKNYTDVTINACIELLFISTLPP